MTVPRLFDVTCYSGYVVLKAGTNCTLGSCQGVKCPISAPAIKAAIISEVRPVSALRFPFIFFPLPDNQMTVDVDSHGFHSAYKAVPGTPVLT